MPRGAADNIEIVTHATGPREVIALGIPSFGMVHLYFCGRLFNIRHPQNRIVRQIYVIGKEVGHARNEIAARALAISEQDPSLRCSKLLFLDDDLLFHPDALLKLAAHDLPLVSGLYYAKTSVPQPLIFHGQFDGAAKSWTPGDLVDCAGHGMGLCLINAEVLRRMRDELDLGVDKFGYPKWFETVQDSMTVAPDGTPHFHSMTEDWNFLQKAARLGYQPRVDTSAQAFAWHLDTRTLQIYPQAQWREFQERGTVTWPTDGPPVVWSDAV